MVRGTGGTRTRCSRPALCSHSDRADRPLPRGSRDGPRTWQRLHRTRWPDQLPDVGWEPALTRGGASSAPWAHPGSTGGRSKPASTPSTSSTERRGERLHFLTSIARGRRPAACSPTAGRARWSSSSTSSARWPTRSPMAVTPPTPSTSWSRPSRATASRARPTTPASTPGRWPRRSRELMADLGYDRYGAQGGTLGLGGHPPARPHRRRARGRHPREHDDRGPPAEGAFDDVSEAELAALGEGAEMAKTGIGLPPAPVDQAADPGLRADGLAGGPRRLAARVPRLDRPRPRRGQR